MEQHPPNNNDQVIVREIRKEDAPEYLTLCHTLDTETTFMLLEPGERKTNIAEQEGIIDRINTLPNQTMLVAVLDSDLLGFIVAIGGAVRRNKHCV